MSSRQPVRQQAFRYPPAVNGGHMRVSSRSYPSFLSLQATLALQCKSAVSGLHDAFRWNIIVLTIAGDAEIRSNVYKSLLLNSISLTSIYAFDFLLLPLVHGQRQSFYRNIGWFYQILWLLPVVGVSFYLNNSWCSLVAQRTYSLQRGHRTAAPSQPVSYHGILRAIATSAYRVLMVCTSLMVSFALKNVPYAGPLASFAFMCWLDSYYCFEFVWQAQGLSLSRRVRYLEERWAYFFAFGLPSALLCNWSSGLASATLFALVFPLYIIMAMHARPVPIDPYNPLPPASQSNSTDVVRYPSPLIPIRLPIFAVVLLLNDLIVRILNVGSRRSGSNASVLRARHKSISDSVEGVEEGRETESNTMRGSWNGHGIRVERRRKAD